MWQPSHHMLQLMCRECTSSPHKSAVGLKDIHCLFMAGSDCNFDLSLQASSEERSKYKGFLALNCHCQSWWLCSSSRNWSLHCIFPDNALPAPPQPPPKKRRSYELKLSSENQTCVNTGSHGKHFQNSLEDTWVPQ